VDGPHGPAHGGRADLREFNDDARLGTPQGACSCAGPVAARLGIAATLAANIARGLVHGLIGAAVAAWPTVALVGSYELLTRAIRGSQVPAGYTPGSGDDADPLQGQAAEVFAEQLTAGRVPQSVPSELSFTSARHVHSACGTTLPEGGETRSRARRITGDQLTHRAPATGRHITCQIGHVHRLLVELAKQSLALGRVRARFRHGRPVDSR
jgi:hypothetical protein